MWTILFFRSGEVLQPCPSCMVIGFDMIGRYHRPCAAKLEQPWELGGSSLRDGRYGILQLDSRVIIHQCLIGGFPEGHQYCAFRVIVLNRYHLKKHYHACLHSFPGQVGQRRTHCSTCCVPNFQSIVETTPLNSSLRLP